AADALEEPECFSMHRAGSRKVLEVVADDADVAEKLRHLRMVIAVHRTDERQRSPVECFGLRARALVGAKGRQLRCSHGDRQAIRPVLLLENSKRLEQERFGAIVVALVPAKSAEFTEALRNADVRRAVASTIGLEGHGEEGVSRV